MAIQGELSGEEKRWLGVIPLFNPEKGSTVVAPLASGPGWWAGAPSALYDRESRRFYLYYRLRKPRELGRGVECRIADSRGGIEFSDIWSATKQAFDTPSMEKSALVKTWEGNYRLYLSFVDPADNKWRIDMLEASSPNKFDASRRTKILTASDTGAQGVKDPSVLTIGRAYYMIVSYAPSPAQPTEAQQREMHGTGDVYNTGITKSHTGLAISSDGINFEWLGDILTPPDSGWDAYCTRISSVIYRPPAFTAFYDGSASVEENYEEKTGLAVGFDLTRFHRVSTGGPTLVSPHASGSLRYIDALPVGERIYYYYEYTRPDGSHELRVSVAEI